MASNLYTVNGVRYRRSQKQGRKTLPAELVKVKVEGMTLPATKSRIKAEARKHNMSLSAYVDLAVSLFDLSKFPYEENC